MTIVLEEIVRNYHIVLQSRINGIAFRMTLKSSEIKNFLSWRVSTILTSCLVASASCHLALPHIIRPTLRVLKLCAEDHLSVSRIRSPHLLVEVILRAEEVFSLLATGYAWSNWAPGTTSINVLSRIRKVLEDEQVQFCFSLWSACICKYFRLRCGSLLLVVVVLFRRSSLWPTCSMNDKICPTSENCLSLQIKFWFPLRVLHCK